MQDGRATSPALDHRASASSLKGDAVTEYEPEPQL